MRIRLFLFFNEVFVFLLVLDCKKRSFDGKVLIDWLWYYSFQLNEQCLSRKKTTSCVCVCVSFSFHRRLPWQFEPIERSFGRSSHRREKDTQDERKKERKKQKHILLPIWHYSPFEHAELSFFYLWINDWMKRMSCFLDVRWWLCQILYISCSSISRLYIQVTSFVIDDWLTGEERFTFSPHAPDHYDWTRSWSDLRSTCEHRIALSSERQSCADLYLGERWPILRAQCSEQSCGHGKWFRNIDLHSSSSDRSRMVSMQCDEYVG